MTQVFQRAKKEAGYTATRFAQMLGEHGGLETAKMLLHSSAVSEGFTALWEADRLDLAVEYQVLLPEFSSLFSREEIERARQRLLDYGMADKSLPATVRMPPTAPATPVPDSYRDVVHLMDGLVPELRLTVTDTDVSRKYRLGSKGPSAWIQPCQGKLYFDLRTFRRANPGDSGEDLRAALQSLSSEDVKKDMAAIPLRDALARSEALISQVIEPFFAASPGQVKASKTQWKITDASIAENAALDGQPGETGAAQEISDDVLIEISRRRNAVEVGLRRVLAQGLRYAHGQKAGSVLIGCLSENRREALVGLSYREMWQELYFNELRDIVKREWAAFSGWFGQDKDKVLTWLEHINRSRADAHAKSISGDDLAYLRVCFTRLEEALELKP